MVTSMVPVGTTTELDHPYKVESRRAYDIQVRRLFHSKQPCYRFSFFNLRLYLCSTILRED